MKRILLLLIVPFLFIFSTLAQKREVVDIIYINNDGNRVYGYIEKIRTGFDIVYLKDGSIIRGSVEEFDINESIKIKTDDGSLFVYPANQVLRIQREVEEKRERTKTQFWSNLGEAYRGYADVGYGVGIGKHDGSHFGVSTTHGFEFGPYVYLGAGMGFNYYYNLPFDEKQFCMPLYLNSRFQLSKSRIAPFIDLKAGYSLTVESGFYGSPSIGLAYALKPGLALNFSLSYTIQMIDADSGTMGREAISNKGFSSLGFRIGVEF